MSHTVISVENVSKYYRLGLIGGGTLRADFERWWAKVRHKPDPLLKIGQEDQGNRHGEYIWALRDVSFQVQQGEVVGIIGRNGAGKSTLLKILSRVTAPTSGQVKIKGRVASLLEVGTGFHPELTGRENIYLNGAILGMKKAEIDRKFDEIVAFAEIEKFMDTPVKRYSSGMYVRLAFAVAAHLEPEILLVDEVLAVGDAAFQKKCLGKMGDVAKEGRTVLFVSHNMAAVQALCSWAILLNSGVLVEYGPTDTVITHYLQASQNLRTEDLYLRRDRSGNGCIRFTTVKFFNEQGEEIGVVQTGQTLKIAIDFVSTEENAGVDKWMVAIGICGMLGENLLVCSNELSGDNLGTLPQKGRATCEIPRFPLVGGTYSLTLYSQVNGVIADWIADAVRLQVESGDFFGTGRLPPVTHSKFLTEHSWYLE